MLLLTVLSLCLLPSCSSSGGLELDPVGPLSGQLPSSPPRPAPGHLEVYNQRRFVNDGGIRYEQYTPYVIYGTEGQRVKGVQNSVGTMDQHPMTVRLPEGRYLVVAHAEGYGRVRVPVIICSRQLTQVYLTHEGHALGSKRSNQDWVRLPDGPVVGRRIVLPESTSESP